jgi:opacity protein-like surface antigen
VALPSPITLATGAANGGSQFGWVAGAGLEYKVSDHWITRAEYLHYDFNDTTLLFTGLATFGAPASESINVVRGGVSYKF